MRAGLLHADSTPRAWQDHSCRALQGGFVAVHKQQVRVVTKSVLVSQKNSSIEGASETDLSTLHVLQVGVSRTLRVPIAPMVSTFVPLTVLMLFKTLKGHHSSIGLCCTSHACHLGQVKHFFTGHTPVCGVHLYGMSQNQHLASL